MTGSNRPDRITLGVVGFAVLLGGMNFVAVRYSNRELAPNFGAGTRFAAAAVMLVCFMVVRRLRPPKGRELMAALLYAVLAFAVPYSLMYWALQDLSAGVAAVVFATTPLTTMVVAVTHRLERFSWRGLLGALITIAGIVVLADPGGATVPVTRLLAVVAATVAAAEASVVMKLVPPTDLAATNATAMAVGAMMLLVVSRALGEPWGMPHRTETWVAFGYLVVLGSVGFFALFLFALRRWTATGVAYMTPLLPVVAMFGGSVVAGEPITRSGLTGCAVVMIGVYVGALSGRRSRVPLPVSVPEEAGAE
jgi:drug/metabolite transporter (DMT)-like permease